MGELLTAYILSNIIISVSQFKIRYDATRRILSYSGEDMKKTACKECKAQSAQNAQTTQSVECVETEQGPLDFMPIEILK